MAQGPALGRFLGPKVVSETELYILGSSYSGVVVAVGQQVNQFKIGDEVIGIPQEKGEQGFWPEYRCVNVESVMLKPKMLSHEKAAAIIIGGCVAYGMFVYVFGRMFFSRFRGPHYIFSEKYPRLVLNEALALITEHDMQLAIAEMVPLELAAMKAALVQVASHHTQGRIVVSV